mmetsp:Transcript_24979/g.40123  ORF Transcript_24979/g.40123 Transcript_24979/m.40123 type:complete len:228 (-) Transcript_24979:191-874(-)|eukprot:jgi/Bigna1/66171/fgenesh1_pg.1_\
MLTAEIASIILMLGAYSGNGQEHEFGAVPPAPLIWKTDKLPIKHVKKIPYEGLPEQSALARKILMVRGRIGGFHDGLLYPFGRVNFSPFSTVPGSRLAIHDEPYANKLTGVTRKRATRKPIIENGVNGQNLTAPTQAGLPPNFMPPTYFPLPKELAANISDKPHTPEPKELTKEEEKDLATYANLTGKARSAREALSTPQDNDVYSGIIYPEYVNITAPPTSGGMFG